jgi:glutamine kinase
VGALHDALRTLTDRAIGRCPEDVKRLEDYLGRYREIEGAGLPALEKARHHLEDVRRVGVPVFAHLARHAFIAVDLLRSIEAVGAAGREEIERFLASLRTVPSVMQMHAAQVARGEMRWEGFVAEYGHLRPGSYDIVSLSYAEAAETYLRPLVDAQRDADAGAARSPDFQWSAESRGAIEAQLESAGLEPDVHRLTVFLRDAIEGREYGKFTFMRGVDAAFRALIEFGEEVGLSREELSHLKIQEILAVQDEARPDVGAHLKRLSAHGREAFFLAQAICLPGVILSEGDFECFEQYAAEPNFVTHHRVQAEVTWLTGEGKPESDLRGCILVIPNADPGYDWIFGQGLAGLITVYGGVNSHMAIRAAEFGLPAAIGIGEFLSEQLAGAALLDLDCAARRIRVIR